MATSSAGFTTVENSRTKAKSPGILKDARTKHGETLTLNSDATKTSFTAEFRLPVSSPLNLATAHAKFVQELITATDGDIRFIPTSDDPSPSNLTSIGSIADFPKHDKDHKAFFHRTIRKDDKKDEFMITLKHTVTSTIPMLSVKKKMFDFLRNNNIWMRSNSFDREETSVIAWLFEAHPSMLFRPALEQKINAAINSLTLTDDQRERLHKLSGDETAKIPPIFLSSRTLSHGNEGSRVSTQAVAISSIRAYALIIKDLVSQIPASQLDYRVIPVGFHLYAGAEAYKKYLVANNDAQNNHRGIAVIGLKPACFDWIIQDKDGAEGSLRELFQSSPLFVSIEATNNSESKGRYLFVVQDANYDAAKTWLVDFMKNWFPKFSQALNYGENYGHLPRLSHMAPTGGAVQKCVDQLILDLTQAESGGTLPTTMPDAWKSPKHTKFVFSLADPTQFPTPNNNSQPASVTPPALDSQSLAAPRSVTSTDLSTVISSFETIMSRQSTLLTEIFKKQQEQQTRRDQELEANQKRRDDRLDSILATLVSLIHHSSPPPATATHSQLSQVLPESPPKRHHSNISTTPSPPTTNVPHVFAPMDTHDSSTPQDHMDTTPSPSQPPPPDTGLAAPRK
jgi:hypothetical protein